MRSFFRTTTLAAMLSMAAYALPGCSSDDGSGAKMEGGAMDKGKMEGGTMDKGKMDSPPK